MGSGSWAEMVEGAVGDSEYLKEQLVGELAAYNEVTEAARWAIVYGLDDSVLPETVRYARQELNRYFCENTILLLFCFRSLAMYIHCLLS